MLDATVGSFWFQLSSFFVIDYANAHQDEKLFPMYKLNFYLRVRVGFFTFHFWQRQKNSTALKKNKNLNTLSPSTHMSTLFSSWLWIKGGKQNRTPWKIQLSFLLNSLCMWFFFFPLRCSPKVASRPAVFFRGCVLITFPSRCLCFIALKPSLRLPPSPNTAQPPPPAPLRKVI